MEKASFSRVNGIVNCPKKYFEVEFSDGEALRTGRKLHFLLEDYIKNGNTNNFITDSFDPGFVEKLIESLQLNGSERIISEYEIMTDQFKGYIDLMIIDETQKTVAIIDLKTITDKRKAKYKLDNAEQMRLYAYFIFLKLKPLFEDGYTMHIGYLLYLKNTKETLFDFLEITFEDACTTYKNFRKKEIVARYILANNLDFAKENENCVFCELQKQNKCKGVRT